MALRGGGPRGAGSTDSAATPMLTSVDHTKAASKKLSPQQIIGQRGEWLVAERSLAMGLSFHCLNRLETGVDGLLELRDPVTQVMLAKWVGVQVKTKEKSRYTAESDVYFEYLLDPSDLAYWQGSNIPVVVVLVRLEDSAMFWKPVASGIAGEARRLVFDKRADGYNSAAADKIASLCVEKGQLGTYVPPMMADDPLHLNLIRMVLPEQVFVGQSLFKSQREATKEMLSHRGPHYFDWVLRDRAFWSFRDPRGTVLSEVVDVETVESLDTAELSEQEDQDDENAFIDLLRRSVEAQVRADLAFHKESKSLYFRAFAPGRPRRYDYRALTNSTSADVVSIHEKEGREAVMRHHAFNPRYQKIGGDWFVSVTPTFVFTVDGFAPHRASSVMLAGKKKLERNGSLRGQFVMWRHFLISSGEPAHDLLTDPSAQDPRPRIRFEALEPLMMDVAVPEDAWKQDDPNASNLISRDTLL